MSDTITWSWLRFSEFSSEVLYDLMVLRQRVFVVEQDCVYLDADGKDIPALHLLGGRGDELMACTRVLPVGVGYEDAAAIGRVVVAPEARGLGLARQMMRLSVAKVRSAIKAERIRLSGQAHLRDFYESEGFAVYSGPYDEDGIPHFGFVMEL